MPVSDSIEPQILSRGNCFLLGESCSFLFQSSAKQCVKQNLSAQKNAKPQFFFWYSSILHYWQKPACAGLAESFLFPICPGNQSIWVGQPAQNLNVEHCILILKTNLEDTKYHSLRNYSKEIYSTNNKGSEIYVNKR